MKKLFKWLTTSLITIITLLALGVTYVTVAVDPNQYRDDIENIANQNGMELSLNGDLEWQLFPLGIRLNQVNYNLKDQSVAGRIDQLWLGLSLTSMLAVSSGDAQLPVSSVSIKDANLFVSRPDQLPIQINAINLKSSNIAVDGKEFPLSLSLQALGGMTFTLDTKLGVVFSQQNISDFLLSDFKMALGDIKLSGTIESSDQMAYISGNLQIQDFDFLSQLAALKQLLPDLHVPVMADPQALRSVSLSGNFNLEPTQTSEVQARLVVDDQPIDINVLIDEQRYKMTTMMSADTFNISPYFLKSTAGASNAALFAPLAIPLALWHGKSQVEVHLAQLELENFSISNIYLNLFGNRNVFKVNSFAADALEGQIDATAKLDLRHREASFNLQSSINNLNLKSLLGATANDRDSPLEGALNLNVNLQGSGNRLQSIIKSLTGNGQLQVLSPFYRDMNIEQTLCSAVAMLTGSVQTNQQWSEGTQLSDFTAGFRFNRGRVIMDNFQTGAGNIDLSGQGSVDLLDQSYKLNNKLLVDKSTTSEVGCSVNQKLQNREIPFVCDGKLGDSVNCRPDANLMKLFLQGAIRDKLSDRIENRVSKIIGLND